MTITRAAIPPMTTGEVAKLARVDSETVRVWERSGKLPAIRTETGQRLFDPADVRNFLERRARTRDAAQSAG
jgi:excisionase family DNA binding protein